MSALFGRCKNYLKNFAWNSGPPGLCPPCPPHCYANARNTLTLLLTYPPSSLSATNTTNSSCLPKKSTTPALYLQSSTTTTPDIFSKQSPNCYTANSPHCSSIDYLQNALNRISSWMTANLLTLNSSKTEFLLIGLSKELAKIHISSLNTTHSAQNPGFIFDEHLAFSDQISHVSKSCYYHIHQLHYIDPYLHSKISIIATSTVHSKLHYCNSITTCLSLRSPGSNRSTTLLHVLL